MARSKADRNEAKPLDHPETYALRLHPDALFNQPYRTVEVPRDRFAGLGGAWNPLRTSRGVVLRRNQEAPACYPAASIAVAFLSPDMLRVRFFPDAHTAPSLTERLDLVRFPEEPVEVAVHADDDTVTVATGRLAFALERTTGTWHVSRGDEVLASSGSDAGMSFGPPMPEMVHSAEEHSPDLRLGPSFVATLVVRDHVVYGGGGRIAPLQRYGTTLDCYAVKTGGHSGDYGGFPIPWLMTPRGFGIFLNNPWPHVHVDIGASEPEVWRYLAPGGDADFTIVNGPDLPQVVERFTRIVGRIPDPHPWWFRFWVSALAFAREEEVLEVAERLRCDGYPADVIVLDGAWRGGPAFLEKYMTDGEYPTNDLNWHPDFGDGPRLVRALDKICFKLVLHQNSRSWLPATMAREVPRRRLRKEGRECVPALGSLEGDAFYADALAPRHREGIATWWLDHGDRVDGWLAPGVPSRNIFGTLWARASQTNLERDTGRRELTLLRGGGIGAQSVAIPWPGDTRFGQDAFIEDIRFILNAGLSGFPAASVDLGGFMPSTTEKASDAVPTDSRCFDPENLARRLCQGLFFVPVPRMHQSNTDPPKLPWNCPPEIARLYRRMLEERYRLEPYVLACAREAARTGLPLIRPMAFHQQDDPETWLLEDQFYFGPDLIVAPVVTEHTASRDVYLPPGDWINWWTEEAHAGPATVRVNTPLYDPEGLPVFRRASATVPVTRDHQNGIDRRSEA